MSHDDVPPARVILLAEDDAQVRNLVRSVLQRKAYKVLVACDGGEAFNLSEAYPGDIDLFLTDVEMPVTDGISAYRQINGSRPGIRVLFMSGGMTQSDLPEAWPFLSKPFAMDNLLFQIENLLAKRVISIGPQQVNHPVPCPHRC